VKAVKTFTSSVALAIVLSGLVPVAAQGPAPELGQGWLPEFTLTARQLLQLAEATPADKFSWRPAPGVRSISEVYVHLAVGNFFLLERAGVQLPSDRASVPKDPERSITRKEDVLKWLKSSLDAVSAAYQTADQDKKVEFFGRPATADGVFLRILVHNNEHMGQAIAYARMNGVAPPWSKGGQ
jgi:uncharacterized damage-inducible protein DinB